MAKHHDQLKEQLKQFLQQPYGGADAFLENVIYPVFGPDNFEDYGHLNVLAKRPDLAPKAEATGISSIRHIGGLYVEGSQLDIFDITLDFKKQLQRNRVEVQQIVRSIISSYSGAFIIFHYGSGARWEWRFTFFHKGASATDATDAKRYTFLLGPGQSCRTAAENFVKIFEKIDTEGEFEMDDIVRAFDVEALSKEFFGKYKAQYEKFCQFVYEHKTERQWFGPEFETWEDKRIRDYVKRMLGRIVFLHFLQKKGWLGVPADGTWGEGDVQFMKHLFDEASPAQQADYLDAVLEPMFADLDTLRDDDVAAAWCSHLLPCAASAGAGLKIPYLNGGLFERDEMDTPRSVFPADYFCDLFNFFYQYNFTIDENDPDDAQVGVDPEMLGRIFENLLEDNKDKGAFYTPKEIVQYMCRESLIAYLQTGLTDEPTRAALRSFVTSYDAAALGGASSALAAQVSQQLKTVKICDPAIGSGAFPMGLLRELFLCRSAIEGFDRKQAADIKRHIIQQNIYGVDIEKGAVDIARLRFWLTLILDEETPHALPNLDFKIMQGNSLLEQYQGIDLTLVAKTKTERRKRKLGDMQLTWFETDIDVTRSQLKEMMKEYYSCEDHARRSTLRDAMAANVKSQIQSLNGELDLSHIDVAANSDFFLWHTWFADVFEDGGFDIVIGNPPYIKEYENRKAFEGFREASPYYIGKMDLWHGFACHFIDMLKRDSVLAFIAQNNWTTNEGAKLLRKKIVEDARILQMIDFNDYMVFGGSASIQTMIMIFTHDSISDNYRFDLRKLSPGSKKDDMLDLLVKRGKHTYMNPTFSRSDFKDKYITFSYHDVLLSNIATIKGRLQSDEVAQGIVFPQDFLNKKGQKKLNKYKVGDGIFGLSDSELRSLNLTVHDMSLIKPYYTSEQIHRYYVDEGKNKLWMIYTGSEFKKEDSMDSYPALKAHLDCFKEIFTSDNKPYGLHRARKESFFQGEKITSLRKCVGHPSFAYSDCDCYVTQTYFSIKTERWDMKFLTGILNSKLIEFWLRYKGKMQGANFQIDKEPLLNIPLIEASLSQQQPIITLVDQILSVKKANPGADTTVLEAEIDRLVYALYDLTPDEIAIVEG